jgi:hypothetical protein
LNEKGTELVDGGIVGPPPTKAGVTRLYLSGKSAEEVSKLFTRENAAVLVDLGNGKHHIITKYDIIGSIK